MTPEFEDISGTGTVITSLTGSDDNSATISPGFDFTFYGVNYNSFNVNTNGTISLGGSNSNFSNTDLTTSPTVATIAPYWDDLHMSGGQPGSNAYYQVLGAGASERLVIQWNEIRYFGGTSTDPITFQAVLFADGGMQFNYLDLVNGGSFRNDGASATVGIKAAGPQGPDRMLLAFNDGPNTFVGTGKSTRIALLQSDDWYSVTLGTGETTLQIESATPADGPGEFVNTLDPSIELYDSTGTTLIASGSPLADGRNESIDESGLTAGATYLIRVSSQNDTTGEYFIGTKTVTPGPVITVLRDDGDWGFQVTGPGWIAETGDGYQGDTRVHSFGAGGSARNVARWIMPPSGPSAEVFVTWVAAPGNATNATYKVYDGPFLRGTIEVDQTQPPSDVVLQGGIVGSTPVPADSLGTFTFVTPMLRVELLTLGANGDLVADGVFDPPGRAPSNAEAVDTALLGLVLDQGEARRTVELDADVTSRQRVSANRDAAAPLASTARNVLFASLAAPAATFSRGLGQAEDADDTLLASDDDVWSDFGSPLPGRQQ